MPTPDETETWKTDPDAAYAEAERRIAEAAESNASSLDLTDKGQMALATLPPTIADLTALQWLTLDKTAITDLAALASLSRLQTLSLNGTKVSDLAPIAGMTNLKTLALDGTNVTDLSPLAGLTKLRSLRLNRTEVSDLGPLASLTDIRSLKLKGTKVADLSPLKGLSKSLIEGAKRGKGNGLSYANTPAAETLAHLAKLREPDRTIETLKGLAG